ncbi:hypothetical protein LOK49_LG14G00180 [Camellia lanceoleosa]|uniref:Uncharacterized protein n=1 Tax=Camellia lanceoleosa TaxID=1840588 RepID=A0ACC0FAP8_9ERIC|nr:hypothetical protein LOK49_LG14G00180 [Camellia lanceoleosa]
MVHKNTSIVLCIALLMSFGLMIPFIAKGGDAQGDIPGPGSGSGSGSDIKRIQIFRSRKIGMKPSPTLQAPKFIISGGVLIVKG